MAEQLDHSQQLAECSKGVNIVVNLQELG